MKLQLKESRVNIKLMDYFEKEMKVQLYKYDRCLSDSKRMLKISLPFRRVVKITRKRNIWLQCERKNLKG